MPARATSPVPGAVRRLVADGRFVEAAGITMLVAVCCLFGPCYRK